MTTVAPYRENRFQGFARRFSEFYHETRLRPLAVLLCIYLAYLIIYTLLRSMGYVDAAFYVLIVYFVVILIVLPFLSFYGMRQKWRKDDAEFEQRMATLDARLDELLSAYRRSSYGVPDGHVGHDVIEGEVVNKPPRALGS